MKTENTQADINWIDKSLFIPYDKHSTCSILYSYQVFVLVFALLFVNHGHQSVILVYFAVAVIRNGKEILLQVNKFLFSFYYLVFSYIYSLRTKIRDMFSSLRYFKIKTIFKVKNIRNLSPRVKPWRWRNKPSRLETLIS